VDTNGTLPDRLSAVDADYVAMDLKTAPEHYARMGLAHLEGNAVTGVEASKTAERLHRSIQVLRERSAAGELSYELRTTVVPDLVSEADIARMAEMLIPGERIVLAPFRGGRTLDPAYSESAPPTPELMAEYAETLGRSGADVQVRES
jgi:pyruvate formate lyase activating enzyme